ncbi:membrane protein insertion efficiency factor YidD [bacterium]|nr:membrane protein insertion efficiency factor YidD [bacterium]
MKKIVIGLLGIYKKYFSPILPLGCRFTPTCSEYMMIAVEKYGVIKGMTLGTKRLLRCNPFFKGGYDPVP